MMNLLKKFGKTAVGVGAFALIALGSTAVSVHAAAYDYASSSSAIDDLFTGLPALLNATATKVIGLGIGLWVLFFFVRRLKTGIK